MVYVDDFRDQGGRRVRAHMVADTPHELRAMADRIDVPRRWIQFEGTEHEHFALSAEKRARAIEAGAVRMTLGDLARQIVDRRQTTRCERHPACRRRAGHYGWCITAAPVEEWQPHNRSEKAVP